MAEQGANYFPTSGLLSNLYKLFQLVHILHYLL